MVDYTNSDLWSACALCYERIVVSCKNSINNTSRTSSSSSNSSSSNDEENDTILMFRNMQPIENIPSLPPQFNSFNNFFTMVLENNPKKRLNSRDALKELKKV